MADWKWAVGRVYKGMRNKGGEYRGTAFMVSDRWFLTCRHVVREAKPDDIYLYDAKVCSGGVRKIFNIFSDESKNVDVALLELQEPEPMDPLDLVPVRTQPVKLEEKELDCSGFSHENGDRESLKLRHRGYYGPSNLHAVQGLAGKGMSGSPVLHQGQLVGILRVQDAKSTYFTPVSAFIKLLQKHDAVALPNGQSPKEIEPQDNELYDIRIPRTEFDEALQEHMNLVFSRMEFQEVSTRIFELAAQDIAETSIGELLCGPDVAILGVLGWLEQAVSEVMQKHRDDDATRKKLKENAKEILGWLVLRTVDPEWLRTHGKDLLKNQVTIRMTESSCLEIVIARMFERQAQFTMEGQAVRGKWAHGVLCTEAGIEPASTLEDLFKLIWKQSGLDSFAEEKVTIKHEKMLRDRLEAQIRRGKRPYLPVPLDSKKAPLQRDDIIRFHQKIPCIKLILLCPEEVGQGQVLLVDDGKLHAQIVDFFRYVIEEYDDY